MLTKLLASLLIALSIPTASNAQSQPDKILASLISAFQKCGPPEAYQVLEQNVFNIIASQTGGMGCYQAIAVAGPAIDMDLIDQKDHNDGTMSLYRARHAGGNIIDWTIGIRPSTGKVYFISFTPSN
ncbi:hypothetical protein [Paracoccus shanxieyensis]|uniref:DUF4864 domain-containing protein n=1 Tax=Paracoccus shanxieyensis TaxID=2675752 RepID=A0A6L6J1K2_9RHOB|nr:hypothetical protein [Paracoccus shanxieyensis]MTH66039.1 hypothetical protein [Paracoccus shanxieyensis]MTH89302.1 hypothetical protein [Paracoccus shanxieyensis]